MTISKGIRFLSLLLALLLTAGCAPSSAAPETTPPSEPQAVVQPAARTEPAAPAQTEPTTVPTEPEPITYVDVQGVMVPEFLGCPVLDQGQIEKLVQAGNLKASAEAVTTVGEAMLYLQALDNFRNPDEGCQLFLSLLEGDYDYVNTVHFYYTDNYYALCYVEQDGVYALFDAFHPFDNWIYDAGEEAAPGTDLHRISHHLESKFIWRGTELKNIKISVDIFRQMALSYPELGSAQLNAEQRKKLYNDDIAAETITNVVDAYAYLQTKGTFFQPREVCLLLEKLLEGDYEAVGTLTLRFKEDNASYHLNYILHQGMYYALDPFTPFSRNINQDSSDWLFRSENDCLKNTDFFLLVDKLVDAYPFFGTTYTGMEVTMDPNLLLAACAPELGTAELSKDTIAQLYEAGDFTKAAQQISTVMDALNYTAYMNSQEPGLIGRIICERFARLLDGDYAEVGTIFLRYSNNHPIYAYILHQGTYYVVNPTYPKENWMYLPQNDCFKGTDLEQLAQKLVDTNPHPSGNLVRLQISGNSTKPHGTEVLDHIGFTFPVGLGQPRLTQEEILALTQETDYEKVAQTITTLPDAVNYILQIPIIHDPSHSPRMQDANFTYYDSAWQVLQRKTAFSHTMGNLLHYLLEGDYEEVGYVYVSYDKGAHNLLYIYQDGLYYLINQEEYSNKVLEPLWLLGWAGLVGCAEDFQTIADSILTEMQFDGNGFATPDSVYLVKSEGDLLVKQTRNPIFPEGTEVIRYYGPDFSYAPALYDWQSQTRTG